LVLILTVQIQSSFAETISRTIYLLGDNSLIVNRNKISGGDGTQQNPFLIKDLIINPPVTNNGIVISDITKFVKISNVQINGGINGIAIQNSKNIIIEKVSIKSSSDSGIVILGSNNILVNSTTIKDPAMRGIYTNTNVTPTNNYGNSIVNCTLDNTGDTSIMMFGNNTLISKNKILNSKFRSIMVLSPFVNTVIADNYVENSQLEGIFAVGYQNGGTVPPFGRVTQSSMNLYVVGNELKNIHEDGIEFQEGVSNSVMHHNFVHDSPLANSINFGHMNSLELWRNSNNNQIRHNVIYNMGGDPAKLANGILIANSPSNTVNSNTITNVPGFAAFLLWDDSNWPISSNNKIFGNNAFSVAQWSTLNQVDSQDLSTLNTISFN